MISYDHQTFTDIYNRFVSVNKIVGKSLFRQQTQYSIIFLISECDSETLDQLYHIFDIVNKIVGKPLFNQQTLLTIDDLITYNYTRLQELLVSFT